MSKRISEFMNNSPVSVEGDEALGKSVLTKAAGARDVVPMYGLGGFATSPGIVR